MQTDKKIVLIPTFRATHLAKLISSNSQLNGQTEVVYPLGNREGQRFFPDGEVYARLPEWINDFDGRVVVLHSGMPDPNRSLIELNMVLSILSKSKAQVEVFFAYFAYGMQDHASHDGETNMARDIISMLVNYYNVEKIYVLDAHFGNQTWVLDYPIVQVSAISKLYSAVRKDYPDIVFMAPDAGSRRRTKLSGTSKSRHNSYDVEITWDEDFPSKVKGRSVGAVDDLIETGGTLVKFSEVCRQCEAKKVIAVSTHGVLVEGIMRVNTFFDDLYYTNSIDREGSKVDVSGLIANAILAPPAPSDSPVKID